jgi:DNA-binding response OmpR family regulator
MPLPPDDGHEPRHHHVPRPEGGSAVSTPVIRAGELEIDLLHRQVRVDQRDLHLTPLEVSLLYLLAANAGQALTRDEILNQIWGTDFVAESNVVDHHVRNLRAKLRDDWRQPRYIATVPGKGYRFELSAVARQMGGSPPGETGARRQELMTESS